MSFTVAQAVATGEAIERGLKRREAEGKDVSTMGPVVTIMVGRLDDWLKSVYAKDGLVFDPGYLEWAGVAAVKKAHAEFKKRGLRSRVLVAAYRNALQWTELVGGDLVLSPPFAWQQRFQASGNPFSGSTDPNSAGNGSLMRLAPVPISNAPAFGGAAFAVAAAPVAPGATSNPSNSTTTSSS